MILYILETFPSVSESFISREITGLIESDLDIQVLAFRKDLNECGQAKTHYVNPEFTLKKLLNSERAQFLSSNFRVALKLSPIRGYRSFLKFLKTLKHLWLCPEVIQLIKDNEIVHIHAHFATMPTDLAILLSHLTNVPFSFSSHAHDIYTQDAESIDKKLSAAKFMVTCTGHNYQYFKNRLSESNLHKVNMIYHGIPLDDWPLRSRKPNNSNCLKLLTVARLQEKKGLIYLCNAVKLLVDKGVPVKLNIVGDGPLFGQLNGFIQKHKLGDHIELKGKVHQGGVKRHYQEADIFALPSTKAKDGDRDGLPNVLLEALAIGVPVITTAVSGIGELIFHEDSGLIVPENDGNAISQSIIRLSEDHALYDRLVMNGRLRVKRFDIDKSTLALKQLFIEHTIEA